MSGVDTALLGVALVAFLLGLASGIVRLAFGIVSLVAAAIAATALAGFAESLLRRRVASPELALLLGFVAVFALVLLVFSALAWLLRRAVAKLGLGWADRALGAAAGLAAVVAAAGIAGALLLELKPRSDVLGQSLVLTRLAPLARALGGELPQAWRERGRRLLDLARRPDPKAKAAGRRPASAVAGAR